MQPENTQPPTSPDPFAPNNNVTSQAPEDSAPKPAPASSEQPKKKGLSKTAKIVIIAVVSVVVLGIVSIIGFFILITSVVNEQTNEAVAVSDQVVDNIQSGDADAVYALANESFTAATTEAELAALISSISPALQGEETITARQIETKNGDTRAAVVYSIATDEGTRYIRVVLEKEGDNWRVLNFIASPNQLEAIAE